MKRIPYFAALALAVVLATVTFFVRPTQAVNDPCYDSCGSGADARISSMSTECSNTAASQSPIIPDVTFTSHCTDAADGHAGGYSYSCSWHWFRSPPPPGINCYDYYVDGKGCAGGGGFGGGNTIDPTNAACLP
jgi:hypothetical protein